MSNFAEQLERELAQSQEANAGLMKACDALERELTAMTEQRDKLAEALRVATSYPLTESWYKQAIEALAKLKPCD
jgi:anti-sigma factor RsiW